MRTNAAVETRQRLIRLTAIFCVFALAIVASGYSYWIHQRTLEHTRARAEIRAIAELKSEQISNWLRERSSNAEFLHKSPLFGRATAEFLASPRDPGLRRTMLRRLSLQVAPWAFSSLSIVDTSGAVRIAFGPRPSAGEPMLQALRIQALGRKVVVFSDLYRGIDGAVHLDYCVPLFASGDSRARPIALALGRVEPGLFLYPYVQRWPVPSATGETLLVRREGDEVVFVSELRHQKRTSLSLRLPLDQPQLPAAVAAKGYTGALSGRDYRGVEVLAATRRVPNSPWYIVAKVDQSEIDAPLTSQGQLTGAIVLALLVVLAAAIGLAERQDAIRGQAALLASEHERATAAERLNYLLAHANDAIVLFDRDLRILDANERAVQSYGYSRDELLSLSAADLRAPETVDTLAEDVERAGHSDGGVYETVHRRKDSSTFPIELSLARIELDGQVFHQAVIRDVTRRKRAEEALAESESRYRRLAENAPDMIYRFRLRPEPGFDYVNPAATQIIGYTPQEHYADPMLPLKITHPADTQPVYSVMESPADRTIVARWIHKDGHTVWIEQRIVVIYDEAGEPIAFEGVGRDVTQARELDQAKSDFAAMISHELRTPLTVIMGDAALLHRDDFATDPKKVLDSAERILRRGQGMLSMVEDLLAVSRSRSSRLSMDIQETDFGRALRLCADNLVLDAGQTLTVDIPDDMPPVEVDPERLSYAVANLLSNAVKFSPDGGEIVLRARLEDGTLRIEVQDSGVGVAPEDQQRIFDRFTQADMTSTRPFGGFGLGLFIAKTVAEAHGGRVRVDSAVGAGSTFTIEVPAGTAPL